MLGLCELQAVNERAAEKELEELRADTVRGLRSEGWDGVDAILTEAFGWNGVSFAPPKRQPVAVGGKEAS